VGWLRIVEGIPQGAYIWSEDIKGLGVGLQIISLREIEELL
jgi:hypothetical protein